MPPSPLLGSPFISFKKEVYNVHGSGLFENLMSAFPLVNVKTCVVSVHSSFNLRSLQIRLFYIHEYPYISWHTIVCVGKIVIVCLLSKLM